MARVKLNPILEQMHGKVGDLVFKRYGDDTVVSRTPDVEGREWTEAQVAHREQFRQAALYGKLVLADPETRTIYEQAAQAKGKPVFSLTVADFFNAPSVDKVDLADYTGKVGDEIAIRAHDDFQVTAVRVEVMKADGSAVETGAATETPPASGYWVYKATAAVPAGIPFKITVTATDRPGHTGVKAVDGGQ